jgi:hypothetical protein
VKRIIVLAVLRAFHQGPSVVRKMEKLLNDFQGKVEALRKTGADMRDFDHHFAGHATGHHLATSKVRVFFPWEHYDPGRELGTTGAHFMPLLEDDACGSV